MPIYSFVFQYRVIEKIIGVANGRGKASCIWEPLSTWEIFLDKDGKANDLLHIYYELNKKYISK
jgi:hypothetical protein